MASDPRTIQRCGLCGRIKEKRIAAVGWRRRAGSGVYDRLLRLCPYCDLQAAPKRK